VFFSRIGFPRKKYWYIVYVYDCSCVHGLFTLHLLDDNDTLIIKINNTCIMWLKGLKISITNSPPLLVIQQLVSEQVPSEISLTTVRYIMESSNMYKNGIPQFDGQKYAF
jgi:hypothetical protein